MPSANMSSEEREVWLTQCSRWLSVCHTSDTVPDIRAPAADPTRGVQPIVIGTFGARGIEAPRSQPSAQHMAQRV